MSLSCPTSPAPETLSVVVGHVRPWTPSPSELGAQTKQRRAHDHPRLLLAASKAAPLHETTAASLGLKSSISHS